MEGLDEVVEHMMARHGIEPKLHRVATPCHGIFEFPDSTFWVDTTGNRLYIYRSYNKEHRQIVAAFADGDWANVIAVEDGAP